MCQVFWAILSSILDHNHIPKNRVISRPFPFNQALQKYKFTYQKCLIRFCDVPRTTTTGRKYLEREGS